MRSTISPARLTFVAAFSICCTTRIAFAEPATRVYINGEPAPVYFNDGDSFRVLAGPLKGAKARLAGFNTLESFGPVHQWGDWHAKELYAISKLATTNAAQGVWHCTTEMETDVYGRILCFCKDLAVDQIRRGLAHAMTVTAEPSPPEYLAAQKEAIDNRRGMWAHGVPTYVLTSAHSGDEGYNDAEGWTYNRVVSVLDGHSVKWRHKDVYSECGNVCRTVRSISKETVDEVVFALRNDPELESVVMELDNRQLEQIVQDFAAMDTFTELSKNDEARALMERKLTSLRDTGKLGDLAEGMQSCFVYVDFPRRYGPTRPDCLK